MVNSRRRWGATGKPLSSTTAAMHLSANQLLSRAEQGSNGGWAAGKRQQAPQQATAVLQQTTAALPRWLALRMPQATCTVDT